MHKQIKQVSKVGRPRRPKLSPGPTTEARLLDSALTLFAAKGYAATATQEIIEAAGVSKPVLYHYFPSKRALFTRLVGGIYEAGEAAWDAVVLAKTDAAERLRGIARVSFEGSARDPRIPQLMVQTHYGPAVSELREFMNGYTSRRFAQVLNIITTGIVSEELCGGNAASIALLFCCIMDQHINILARLPNAKELLTSERADALVDAFLCGCGTGPRHSPELPAFL